MGTLSVKTLRIDLQAQLDIARAEVRRCQKLLSLIAQAEADGDTLDILRTLANTEPEPEPKPELEPVAKTQPKKPATFRSKPKKAE